MQTADSEEINFDRLWNYQKPDETEQRFRDILRETPPGTPYHAELLTQIARTQSLQRKFAEAHAILDEAASLLTPEMRRATIRYLLERGRSFNSANQKEEALPLFVEAWEIGRETGEDNLAIDAAHMVAIAGTPEEAMEWNIRALDLAGKTTDAVARNWCGSLYNNIGWSYHGEGRFAEALDIFTRALEWRETHGPPGAIRIARWCVARTLRSLGRIDEALAIQEHLLKESEATGEHDGFIFEELGECLLLLNRSDEARPNFARAYEILSKDEWIASNEPARIKRLEMLSGSAM